MFPRPHPPTSATRTARLTISHIEYREIPGTTEKVETSRFTKTSICSANKFQNNDGVYCVEDVLPDCESTADIKESQKPDKSVMRQVLVLIIRKKFPIITLFARFYAIETVDQSPLLVCWECRCPSRFGPPGPNMDLRGTQSASGLGPPSRIWTPYVIVKTHAVIRI